LCERDVGTKRDQDKFRNNTESNHVVVRVVNHYNYRRFHTRKYKNLLPGGAAIRSSLSMLPSLSLRLENLRSAYKGYTAVYTEE
jgi:hypothetical protein